MDRGAWPAIVRGVTESDMTECLTHTCHILELNSSITVTFLIKQTVKLNRTYIKVKGKNLKI